MTGNLVRKIDDLVKPSTPISVSPSQRCPGHAPTSEEQVAAFADRDLSEQAFPYVFLDARQCKARIGWREVR